MARDTDWGHMKLHSVHRGKKLGLAQEEELVQRLSESKSRTSLRGTRARESR